MGATPVAWTRATVTVPSFKTEKEECDHNFSKMEQLIQCSFEHCVQTGMFKYGWNQTSFDEMINFALCDVVGRLNQVVRYMEIVCFYANL